MESTSDLGLGGAPAAASAPARDTDVDLSEGLAAFDAAWRGGAASLSWRGVALGHLELEARTRPMSEETLAGAVLEAIAPALDAYLVGRAIGPRRQLWQPDSEADSPRLLRAALSLLDHRPALASKVDASDAPSDAEPPDVEGPRPPARTRRSLLPNLALAMVLVVAVASCLAQSFAAVDVVPMLLALAAAGLQVVAVVNARPPVRVPARERRSGDR